MRAPDMPGYGMCDNPYDEPELCKCCGGPIGMEELRKRISEV